MTRSSVLAVGLGLLLVAAAFGLAACQPEQPLDLSFATCPNVQPTDGSSCPEAGLVCHYFTGCAEYYPATCGPDLKWAVEDDCVPNTGGLGPAGGGGTSGTPAGGTGGTPAGGSGGFGGSGGGE